MARIHEALRQANHGHEPNPLAELGGGPVLPVEAPRADEPRWESADTTVTAEPASPPVAPLGNGLDALRQQCLRQNWTPHPAYSVFSARKPSMEHAEQFRKLRSRLYEMRKAQPIKTLLVTSAVQAEGKTFVALNLAIAITRQQGRRVLLIDGDLRMPKLASCLGVPGSPGLTEFANGTTDERAIVRSDPEGSLFFAPGGAGVANPTEILAGERFGWFLGRMATLFDWIIIDAPPILPVSDAGVLAAQCDGVLVVVRAGSTSYDAVEMALKELRGKKLLGVVLNRAEQSENFYDANTYYGNERPLPA